MELNEQTQPLPTLSLINRKEGGQGPLMKFDKRKDSIKVLHRMLTILGYNVEYDIQYDVTKHNVDIGHYFDEVTEAAVKEFQEENRDWSGTSLTRDGLVGPKTADSLNRAMVGVFYPVYRTPDKLTSNTPIITVTKLEMQKNGVSLTPGEKSRRARIYVVPPPFSIELTLADFNNTKLPEVEYTIETSDGQKITGKSDSEGRIICNDLSTNKFKLVLPFSQSQIEAH